MRGRCARSGPSAYAKAYHTTPHRSLWWDRGGTVAGRRWRRAPNRPGGERPVREERKPDVAIFAPSRLQAQDLALPDRGVGGQSRSLPPTRILKPYLLRDDRVVFLVEPEHALAQAFG